MEALPIAGERAIELGKKYVHNDICYPAQINIGEALAFLENSEYAPSSVALGLAKNCESCRAGQYPVLARKALDEAGYRDIPVVTTGTDSKKTSSGISFFIAAQAPVFMGYYNY